MNWQKIRAALMVCAVASVAGCGGSESDSVAGGGVGGTGISFGNITGFGSIFVNGVEFSTNSATFLRDDSSTGEGALRRGMVVEVRGSIDSSTLGSAERVVIEESVRGPVESKTGTASAGVLVVLGQNVRLDGTTNIDNNVPDFASISTGMLLEVHGQRQADGSIAASFIEAKTAPVIYAVRGPVTGHDDAAKSFTVGALSVSYAAGATINDMPTPAGSNWNGLFVEVKGSNCSGNPVCGVLSASKIEPDGLNASDAAKAEVEGFVTALTSSAAFNVNSQSVVTTPATVYSGGLPEEIILGAKLEVEGSLVGGILTATKVQFKNSVKIETNAIVSGAVITLEGLPGVTVSANAFTEFKDTSATSANLASLNGRNVRIRGRATGVTAVMATEIENRGSSEPNGDVILQASVDKASVANPVFTLLGVTVDTTSLTSAGDFQNVSGASVSRTEFFSALTANGGLVKAKGRLPAAGNALAASTLREVELED